nr:subtilisin-like protease SBT1.8 [Tanacetum cinerariifolium]
MDYQLTRDREQHLACELFGYIEDSNEVAFVVAAVEKIYAYESLNFNNTVALTVAGNAVTTTMAITEGYGLMILGCAGSLKANLQHMEALSTTKAGYMTFTKAWKKKIWLKGLLTESRYELMLVAGIAIGALVKGGSRFEIPAQVEVAAYRC